MKNVRLMRILGVAACLSSGAVVVSAPVLAAQYSESALQAAGVISKSQAIAIAKAAVGGGTVISAIFEKQDRIPHWSVDIVGAKYEYEVWVSVSGSVLRVITQPK